MHGHPSPSGGSGNWRGGAPPPPVGGPAGGSYGGPYGGGVPPRQPGLGHPPHLGQTDWQRAQDAHMQPRRPEADVNVVIPACPNQFPQIQSMPLEELNRLLSNPSAFDEFIRDHHYRQYVLVLFRICAFANFYMSL